MKIKIAPLLCLLCLFGAFSSCEQQQQKQGTFVPPPCVTKEACINDPNCLCWCSQICNWRKKTAEDHPVYIENDPHGKFCYCKQWDFDHYEDNCINGKNVKQPPGSQ